MTDGSLSLPARLYLLAWDTDRTEVTGAARLPHLVRAGALTELAQCGLLTDDDGIATPVDMDSLAGDAALDGLLELVRESRPHGWRAWVTLHARVTVDGVREQLTADGYLRAERRRVLGVFPAVDHVPASAGFVATLQAEVRHVLEGAVPLVSEQDAAVVALAAAAELPTLFSPGDRQRHRERVEELTGRAGTPVLREVMGELRTAVAVAAGE